MSATKSPSPPRLIHRIENIIDPLDWTAIFPRQNPVEVELGSGDGSFLAEYAGKHPDTNFVGVERLLGRLKKIERKAIRAGLDNVVPIRIESAYFVQYLVPPGSLQAIHLYFPDPWPKRRHLHNRIVNETFPGIAGKALKQGGTVFLRTDHAEYFSQMQHVFASNSAFAPVVTPPDLLSVVTDFECEFNSKGIPTLHAAFEKI